MSLIQASRLLESLGITSASLTHDGDWRDGDLTVTPARRMYPGTAAKVRSRLWMCVLEHRHHHDEPASVLDESWTVMRVQTGPDTAVWRVRHDSCRLERLSGAA